MKERGLTGRLARQAQAVTCWLFSVPQRGESLAMPAADSQIEPMPQRVVDQVEL